jgi:hypothetical protein
VITLRCTARLLAHLKKTKDAVAAAAAAPSPSPSPSPSLSPSTTRLGDLYANLVIVGRKQFILAVAERSFLPVVINAAPAATVVPRLGESLAEVLGQLYLAESDIEKECASISASEVTFAKTASRQVVGVLTDFSFLLERWAEGSSLTNLQLSLKLGDTPCSPLYKTKSPSYPRGAAQALFAREVTREDREVAREVIAKEVVAKEVIAQEVIAQEVIANDWREPAQNDE